MILLIGGLFIEVLNVSVTMLILKQGFCGNAIIAAINGWTSRVALLIEAEDAVFVRADLIYQDPQCFILFRSMTFLR